MTNEQLQLMMLDIDGVLTRYEATTAEVLAAAQQMAVSAIGYLVNQGDGSLDASQRNQGPVPLIHLADAIAEQIRTALHARIAEGKKPDW